MSDQTEDLKTAKDTRKGGSRGKMRGRPTDSPEVRMSKTLSWLLRHGAKSENLPMRPDGYVRVEDLVCIKPTTLLIECSWKEPTGSESRLNFAIITSIWKSCSE
jgi:RNA:NAD 2'-phosphotransferase (TPT1/KptA family)